MSKIFVVTSGKGGVGKTTTAASIGAGLALEGKKTVILDADIGLRNLDVVMGMENRILYDLVNVIEGSCRLKQALIKDRRYDGLFLLPAAQTRDKDCINPKQMQKLCDTLREQFDYVIIDCPAGIEQGFKNAVAGADEAIVVTIPEVSAVRDADRIIGMLARQGIDKPMLVLNRVRPDMVKRGQMMSVEDINDILEIEVLGVIPDDESVIIASNKGVPVIAEDCSMAAQAYLNIVQRILGVRVPLMDLYTEAAAASYDTADYGFFAGIRRLFSKK